MNIFFLDRDHTKNAKFHVDRHVVKLPLEACQMLASTYQNGVAPYKHTHINHPMSKWVRETECNFYFTLNYAKSLCKEYTFRYGKIHACEKVIDWYYQNKPKFASFEATEPPRCFGKYVIPVTDNVIEDYRNYYRIAKNHLFRWKNREQPYWIQS